MNRLDKLSGLFWLIISIIVCVESIRARVGTFKNPGPGFLPLYAGVALGAFAIILLTIGTLRKRVEGKITNPFQGVHWQKVILVIVPLFAYTIFLFWLGYLITTFGLMVFLFGVRERSKFWVEIMIALFTVSASYIVFDKWLGIPLPSGIFGF
jgi:putative tricarboxylic transport membrane protein